MKKLLSTVFCMLLLVGCVSDSKAETKELPKIETMVENSLNSKSEPIKIVQVRLQVNTIDSNLGNPSNVDIYFATEGDKAISLPDFSIDISIETPYQRSKFYHTNIEP